MKGKLMITVMIGLLLLSFLSSIAEAAPGGLPECNNNLNICTTNLAVCTTSLTNAQNNYAVCMTSLTNEQNNMANAQVNLATCQSNLGVCNTNQSNAQMNLEACQATVAEFAQKTSLPSWDKKLACDSTDNCPRFEVIWGNTAVLDKETGLVWEMSPDPTTKNWYDAFHFCSTKNVGGRLGWRLPTVEEVASLIDPTQTYPTLPSGHPFDTNCLSGGCVQSSFYWSSTTNSYDTGIAYGVGFTWGYVTTANKDGDSHWWCVRSGQGYDGPGH